MRTDMDGAQYTRVEGDPYPIEVHPFTGAGPGCAARLGIRFPAWGGEWESELRGCGQPRHSPVHGCEEEKTDG